MLAAGKRRGGERVEDVKEKGCVCLMELIIIKGCLSSYFIDRSENDQTILAFNVYLIYGLPKD